MLLSCRQIHLPSLIVIWLACSGVAGGISPLCPASCTCKPSDKGKRRISCLAGGLTDPIPTGQMDPRIEVLEISAPDDRKNWLSVTSIFQHFKHLEELHIINSNVNQISMHAFWGLPTLKILDLSLNNISGVSDHNFRGLVNLLELNLDDNKISMLQSGVFKHLTELRILSLQRNLIQVLVPRTFLRLVKLHVLKISGNNFEELDPEAFKEIPELRTLECRLCGLQRINTQIYHILPYLTHLDLGLNQMQFLDHDEFQDLRRLHSLKLDGNMFPVILENTFVNQQQLKYLNLAKNRIAKIPNTALKNLSSLIELDIGYNKLSKIDAEALAHVAKTLIKLVISGNNFNIPIIKTILSTLYNVWDLSLANMRVSKIPSNFFPSRIRSLNISGNNLSDFFPELVPKHLEFLDLSGNQIKGLNESAVLFLDGIRTVNISNNPWKCDMCHIAEIFFRVNKSSLFKNVTCAFPSVLKGKRIFKLNVEEIPACDGLDFNEDLSESNKKGLLIGLICIVAFGVSSVIFVVASCVRRHHQNTIRRQKRAAEYEENVDRTTNIFTKHQLNFQFPLDLTERKLSISTIDEIKKDDGDSMPNANGSITTGL